MAGSLKHLSFLQRKSASRIIQTLVTRIERTLAKQADAIIVVSESVGERFRDIGVATAVIPNVPIKKFNGEFRSEKIPHNLVYMGGNLGYVHGIDLCGDLLSSLSARYPDISMTFVGKLDSRSSELPFLKEHADRVAVTGLLPIDRMYREIAQGQVGLLLFQNTHHNMYIGLPNKLFDYMQCGIPSLRARSRDPEGRRDRRAASASIPGTSGVAAAVSPRQPHRNTGWANGRRWSMPVLLGQSEQDPGGSTAR